MTTAEQAHEYQPTPYNFRAGDYCGVCGLEERNHSQEPASEPQAAPRECFDCKQVMTNRNGVIRDVVRLCSRHRTSVAEALAALKPHDVFLLLDEFENAQEANYHISKKRQLAEFIAARYEGKGELDE